MRKSAEQHPGLDHAAKEIIRLVPSLIPRLLYFDVRERSLRFADSSVRSREHRADQVLLVGEKGEPEAFGWHLEFQAGDDRREFGRWNQKNAALNEQLKRPIALVIVYLQPGTAPNAYEIDAGGVRNRHEFAALRLWEHVERIRSGELPELAPFLVLWNHESGEAALTEQRNLLLQAALPQEVLDDLFGWTMVVGSRFFDNESLRAIFDKEMQMLKDFPEVQQWIKESRLEGERQGDLRTARAMCRNSLVGRFGPISEAAQEYLDTRTVDELMALVAQAGTAASLTELGIPA